MSSREQETERIVRQVEALFNDLNERRGEEFANTSVVRVVRSLAMVIARLVATLPEPDPVVRSMVGARVLKESVEYIDQLLHELQSKDGGESGNT